MKYSEFLKAQFDLISEKQKASTNPKEVADASVTLAQILKGIHSTKKAQDLKAKFAGGDVPVGLQAPFYPGEVASFEDFEV